MELNLDSLEALPEVSKEIIAFAKQEKVWLFEGEMGVGKTTLIKALCKLLLVSDDVSSPTFSLVNEYVTEKGETIYHFDLYRIEDEKEAFDIGIEDYLFSKNICLVEWPNKIPSLIPDKYLKISIILGDENCRKINLTRK